MNEYNILKRKRYLLKRAKQIAPTTTEICYIRQYDNRVFWKGVDKYGIATTEHIYGEDVFDRVIHPIDPEIPF